MSLLVVGSVALDSVETPFGRRDDALGGSATYFSCAASYFTDVHLVAVVGDDFPDDHVQVLRGMRVTTDGLETVPGKTFRWAGKYGLDLNERDTLSTELNVFEDFHPKLPTESTEVPYVFLANIHPTLQLEVLEQVVSPKFVALDTMNFWIEGAREELAAVLERSDAIMLNDSEARMLADDSNLVRAARKIEGMGPETVVIKKGEHGCLLFSGRDHFAAPAYPLEDVFDPTGAGDSFAGGFMGYVASCGSADVETMRKAVIYGSVIASFCVETFSVDRLVALTREQIDQRYADFEQITKF